MFRLVTQTLKIIDFEADFSGSLNCEFLEVGNFGSKRNQMQQSSDEFKLLEQKQMVGDANGNGQDIRAGHAKNSKKGIY